MIDQEIQKEVRNIFESSRYYNRQLSDSEVEEIAEGLTSFAEIAISVVKNKYSEEHK
jgi:hypothetical protein